MCYHLYHANINFAKSTWSCTKFVYKTFCIQLWIMKGLIFTYATPTERDISNSYVEFSSAAKCADKIKMQHWHVSSYNSNTALFKFTWFPTMCPACTYTVALRSWPDQSDPINLTFHTWHHYYMSLTQHSHWWARHEQSAKADDALKMDVRIMLFSLVTCLARASHIQSAPSFSCSTFLPFSNFGAVFYMHHILLFQMVYPTWFVVPSWWAHVNWKDMSFAFAKVSFWALMHAIGECLP